MFEVTFSSVDGTSVVLVDGGRWRATVEENRPYLSDGDTVSVRGGDYRRVYWERIGGRVVDDS